MKILIKAMLKSECMLFGWSKEKRTGNFFLRPGVSELNLIITGKFSEAGELPV